MHISGNLTRKWKTKQKFRMETFLFVCRIGKLMIIHGDEECFEKKGKPSEWMILVFDAKYEYLIPHRIWILTLSISLSFRVDSYA